MNYYIFKPYGTERYKCSECTKIHKRFVNPAIKEIFQCPSMNLLRKLSFHNIFLQTPKDKTIKVEDDTPCLSNYYVCDLIYKLIL